ncbi:unnamed protein product, partial [Prorocentrum cordatum]
VNLAGTLACLARGGREHVKPGLSLRCSLLCLSTVAPISSGIMYGVDGGKGGTGGGKGSGFGKGAGPSGGRAGGAGGHRRASGLGGGATPPWHVPPPPPGWWCPACGELNSPARGPCELRQAAVGGCCSAASWPTSQVRRSKTS